MLHRLAWALAMPLASLAVPAAAPATAQETQASWSIFFARDDDDLAYGASDVADAVVAALKARAYREVLLEGNVDTILSGAAATDRSRRIAETVRFYLVGHGIDARRIRLVANGASKPMVPTGPAIAEPLNRRVQIIVSWQ